MRASAQVLVAESIQLSIGDLNTSRQNLYDAVNCLDHEDPLDEQLNELRTQIGDIEKKLQAILDSESMWGRQ